MHFISFPHEGDFTKYVLEEGAGGPTSWALPGVFLTTGTVSPKMEFFSDQPTLREQQCSSHDL